MTHPRRLGLTLFLLLLFGCTPAWGTQSLPTVTVADGSSTYTPFLPLDYTPLPVYDSTPTLVVQTVWIAPSVPAKLNEAVRAAGYTVVTNPDGADVRLEVSLSSTDASTTWIYALVAPFPTTTDGVSITDIQSAWAGVGQGPFASLPLWMDETTLAAFTVSWGAPGSGSVRVATTDQLLDSAWAERPSWAIVSFEALEPRWKVLTVDGQSPIHNDFDPATYPLKVSFSLQPAAFSLPTSNRDPDKLTVLIMTGVTALVRGTADKMERYGVLYPGEEIRTVLRAADITHISNEIPFMAGCPTPDPWTESLIFCSDPRYIALLEDVGADVVELTGNHMLDYGPEAMQTTLDMYDNQGWPYFGGGRNLQDSLKAALIEHNENKLAFIGCNLAGPPSDWATDARPGSTPCQFDQLSNEIGSLRSSGYLPIMTFQYNEYYQPNPTDYERTDFLNMVAAGAVIVSGSQSHVPAAMEFSDGAFIHYGLGNLFFDQMSHLMPDGSTIYDTRNVVVDRHVFYDGRYISTELLTYIIEDYARPRLMLDWERLQLLQVLFEAGGWGD